MKNADPNTLFKEQLKVLKLEYCQSFPEKISELKTCWQGLGNDHDDQAVALARNAHKLAGSAGSFGHPEISQHAHVLCDLVEEAVASGEIKLQKKRNQIQLQTERLCTALTDQYHAAIDSKLTVEKS